MFQNLTHFYVFRNIEKLPTWQANGEIELSIINDYKELFLINQSLAI